MRILLIASAFNGLCQRIHRELSVMGHNVSLELAISPEVMEEAAIFFQPDLIICPFLKQRIPARVWREYVCLIVHPGIEGDRGPSSLDWALLEVSSVWGVTLLQAVEEMDAGDIWATGDFPLRQASKSSLYGREVTSKAVELIKAAVHNFQDAQFKPRPLDYSDPRVAGRYRPYMRQADRRIDWQNDNTDVVMQKMNAADSQPGILDDLFGTPVYLYGARRASGLMGKPGAIIAQSHGAVCRATADGAVWIRQAKLATLPDGRPGVKLPASQALAALLDRHSAVVPSTGFDTSGCEDIKTTISNGVGYLYFDFCAGALSYFQCRLLRSALVELKKQPIKVIVLMGGEDYWCNGIDLNGIEAAEEPARVAWNNIQAIDDLVLEIIDTPNQITVAALRNNAGAGGAIMALACDRVVVREGVVLNPHYRSMGLYGSEYWTYLLPARVGEERSQQIATQCLPMLSAEALSSRLVDAQLEEDWCGYHLDLVSYCEELGCREMWKDLVVEKNRKRKRDEKEKPLQAYRQEELRKMRECFFDPASDFHRARHNFVHKIAPLETPPHLALHRRGWRSRKAVLSKWINGMISH